MMAGVNEAVARLCEGKVAQRQLIERQIAALERLRDQAAQAPGPDVLLMLYLDAKGAMEVARFCNAQGWRLPGAKGPRQYKPDDVYSLVREDQPPADPQLRAMAREKLDGPPGRRVPRPSCWD